MRRLIIFAGAVVGLACASLAPPPGGPQRKVPPKIDSIVPESGTVNFKDKSAVFYFDVIVDDHAGHNGSLAGSFLLSPNEGGTVVNWKRNRIEVRPKRGFRPGVAYSVTMLPGVSDLNRNAMKETRVTTFSTGATIPPYSIQGRVFDWMAERTVGEARVDILRMPDSLPYVGVSDSTGQFAIGPLDQGTYAVRALVDANRNGLKDLNEIWDSTTVVVKAESPFIELRAATRDTIGPRLLTVAPLDSLTLQLSFDHPLDPGTTLTPANFRVQRADSTPLIVTKVQTQSQFQVIRLARDSARNKARLDSIAKLDTTPRPAAPPPPPAAAPDLGGQRVLPVITAPKPSIPAPARDIVIELDTTTKLVPGSSYRISVTGARSLAGVVRASDRAINVPRRDTTKAPVRKP